MGEILQDPFGTAQVKEDYDSIEFTLNTATTDYDLDSNQSNFKANVDNPCYVQIISDQIITVKFNATTNHPVTIQANTLKTFDRQIAKNIYLSNSSGSNAAVKIYVK